LKDKDFM